MWNNGTVMSCCAIVLHTYFAVRVHEIYAKQGARHKKQNTHTHTYQPGFIEGLPIIPSRSYYTIRTQKPPEQEQSSAKGRASASWVSTSTPVTFQEAATTVKPRELPRAAGMRSVHDNESKHPKETKISSNAQMHAFVRIFIRTSRDLRTSACPCSCRGASG